MLYPAIRNEQIPMVFRITATLREIVNADLLQTALERVIERFPYFKVRLRAGFFWYYFERNNSEVRVRAETGTPCETLPDSESGGYLFRVQAYSRRIAVEFFHVLTDGAGGLAFLKTLIAAYLELKGNRIAEWGDLLNPEELPDPEEFEDAYHRYTDQAIPKSERLKRAFRLPFPLRTVFRYSYLTGECSAARFHDLAQAQDVSVTEYLAGLYIYVLQEIYRDLPEYAKRQAKKIIRLEIPVDMRRYYPSKSMKNFSLFVTPGIDVRLGWYTLEDIVKQVHYYMRTEVDPRRLNKQLARNVNPEHNAFVRSIPLLVKNSILQTTYNTLGTTQFSGVLTNLGRISMPECIVPEVESFTFIPSPGKALRIHGAVATFGDRMRIAFGSVTDVKELERRFFRLLVELGIPVKVFRFRDV